MKKETKKQFILSVVLLSLLLGTLYLWYGDFYFHSYSVIDDYEYAYEAKNDVLSIQNYEFSKHQNLQVNGGARIMALQDNFFIQGDIVDIEVKIDDTIFKHSYTVQSENEVFILPTQQTDIKLSDNDFKHVSLYVKVTRNNETVYSQELAMKKQELSIYSGSNKDYMIQNVYVSDSWLKAGDFTTSDKGLKKKYSQITIDYLYLKDNGNRDNLDDYERFLHITGSIDDVLSGKLNHGQFYDDKGSLLERTIICVVTLDDGKNPISFKVPLSLKKVVESHVES